MRIADLAICQRPAGLHGDFPEHDFSQLGEQGLDKIGLADRHAAGANDHIADRTGVTKRLFQPCRIVADHAHVEDLAAQAGQHAVQRIAVAVVNLAFAEPHWMADRDQLVAGGEKHHPQRTVHADLGDAQ